MRNKEIDDIEPLNKVKDRSDYFNYPDRVNQKKIQRQIKAGIGKNWNETYSRLCQQYTSDRDRKTLDDNIAWMINNKVVIVNDKPLVYSTWVGWSAPTGLYIDPRDGILKNPPQTKKEKYTRLPYCVAYEENWYKQYNKIWFRIWIEPVNDNNKYQPWFRLNKKNYVIVRKMQCGKSVVKQLNQLYPNGTYE